MNSRPLVSAACLDVSIVLFFVAVGRAEHDSGNTFEGLARTSAPFLAGLGIGWLTARAWRRPAGVGTGLLVWPVTVLVGMIVRRGAFDDGTATSFVIVTTAFLGFCLVGWRLVVASVSRRQRTTQGSSGALSRR